MEAAADAGRFCTPEKPFTFISFSSPLRITLIAKENPPLGEFFRICMYLIPKSACQQNDSIRRWQNASTLHTTGV